MQFFWLNIRSQFLNVRLKIRLLLGRILCPFKLKSVRREQLAVLSLSSFIAKNDSNICMLNENDKYNVEQSIAKIIVCSWDDRKLCKSTFENRAALQIYNLWLYGLN